jgi:hypothetical protein
VLESGVIALRNLDEVERRQLMLADNRIALNAGWDAEMLRLELNDLGKLGVDLKILGFSEQELAVALGGSVAGLVHEDEVPGTQRNRDLKAGRYLDVGAAPRRVRR